GFQMLRPHPIVGFICRVVALMALTCLTSHLAYGADEIHRTLLGTDGVSVDWRGSESSLSYGLTPAYSLTVPAHSPVPLPVSSPGPFWQATIRGLVPNTTYHYSIGTGADHTF